VNVSRADELNAELRVVDLEQRLVEAKGSAMDDDEFRALKDELRAARQEYRELREGRGAGDGEARPESVSASAQVEE
jgi:hypothetical protein